MVNTSLIKQKHDKHVGSRGIIGRRKRRKEEWWVYHWWVGSGTGGWRAISHPLIWKVIQKSPKSHPYVIQKSPKFQKSSNSNPTVLKSHPEDQQFPPIFPPKKTLETDIYSDSPHLFENHHTIQFVQSIKTKSPHLLLVQIELGHSSLMLVISRPQRQRGYGDYSRKCLHCLKFVSPSRRLALLTFL